MCSDGEHLLLSDPVFMAAKVTTRLHSQKFRRGSPKMACGRICGQISVAPPAELH